ncbi:aminodeoxychorismate synthase component I [Sphingobium sp. CR28]|uniref:aminodeoxychorismate synthase component I n=1 Tax=Sphingobium sp. CR28 TaxID=3400272 RepID=UPI003FF08C35
MAMLPALPADPAAPFVLLDDARAGMAGEARLYRDPMDIIRADTLDTVPAALDALDAAGRRGLHAAGYLTYEAGHALQPRRLKSVTANDGPLLWFGLFEDAHIFPADSVPALLPVADHAGIGAITPTIGRSDYDAAIAKVLGYIRAGDIYQANLTFPSYLAMSGDPLAAYAAIRRRAAAGHGGIVRHDGRHLLSFSPELFFTLDDDRRIATRPMKGTAARDPSPETDRALAEALARDPKQRAENLMIVDLLRNDISRVADAGSVHVPELFAVESYPTVHQMVSQVEGRLRDGLGPVDVLRALFPCGSITGAPKLRAMEVISEVERHPRGVYTGSIGAISPDGTARFNVAIRTICVNEEGAGTIGLGSGIVADSRADDEWRECLAKGHFLAES